MSEKGRSLFERARRAEQAGNREARDLWDRFRHHREHVTAAILAQAPGTTGGRLCLLGAGNANDLDLAALTTRFDEVHLVDIDPSALARAVGRQLPGVRAKLRSHAPIDLSGMYQPLDRHALPAPDHALVDTAASEVLRQLPSNMDVVASCCVLSQAAWALQRLVVAPARFPLPALEHALVRIHLRIMLGLLRRGGAGVLVSDLTSSRFYPPLAEAAGLDLRALMLRLAAQRAAYAVCNPELLRQTIRHDAALAADCLPLAAGDPWLWDGPNGLTYLVYPFLFRRHGAAATETSLGD